VSVDLSYTAGHCIVGTFVSGNATEVPHKCQPTLSGHVVLDRRSRRAFPLLLGATLMGPFVTEGRDVCTFVQSDHRLILSPGGLDKRKLFVGTSIQRSVSPATRKGFCAIEKGTSVDSSQRRIMDNRGGGWAPYGNDET
jgi:hypothetical protein